MSSVDRSIALARTRDGRCTAHFAHRIRVDGPNADVLACPIDLRIHDENARVAWHRWSEWLPDRERQNLVAESGLVREGDEERGYTLVRSGGVVLELDGLSFDGLPTSETLGWEERPPHAALVLGPSAVLALADFAIDGIEETEEPGSSFGGITLVDTPHSPYAPQHRAAGRPKPVGCKDTVTDNAYFLLLQRSEHWQRPLATLYNVDRRNLAISHRDGVASPPVAIVIDTLAAEGEPTHAESTWIAGWHLSTPAGGLWGRGMLSLRCDVTRLLEALSGATSPPGAACLCDPIEGDIFGTAPALLVGRPPRDMTLTPAPP